MTDKTKPTPGPWEVGNGVSGTDEATVDAPHYQICTLHHHAVGSIKKEMHANARLIAEAGTVHHETGLTPRELVEKITELKSECFTLAADQCHDGYAGEYGDHRCRYQDRIAELVEKCEALSEQRDALLAALEYRNACMAGSGDLDNFLQMRDAASAKVRGEK